MFVGFLSAASSSMQVAIPLGPILRENNPGMVQGFPTTNLSMELLARRIFRVPPCSTGLHLQTSIPPPEFDPWPNGTVVSVTNRYSGWSA
ncbi:hypothetical protein TNCV_4621911 [Trichonephila clavipes]|nr:hypothetical protein TNCV_4621911 [Trichonephila clavipes]